MADYMVRALGAGGNVRVFVATATAMVDEARRRHDTWPTVSAAMGRTLVGTALLSATLKEQGESVTVRIDGDGPVGGITCDADEQGQVRGYVRNPHVDLDLREDGKLNVGGAVGLGFIHVTRHLSVTGTYTGSAPLISGEIGEDFAEYLTQSEQTASAVGLGVRVAPDGAVVAAGGFLLQLLPATAPGALEQVEVNIKALGAVSLAVEQGRTPEEILSDLMAGLDYRILERRDLQFACRCSRERALDVLALIDPRELDAMIREDAGAEMSCQFCNETYRFTDEELESAKKPGRH